MMSRSEERAGIEIPQRLRLIEGDLDKVDVRLGELVEKLDQRIGKLTAVGYGLLAAFSMSVLLLALNLVVGR